MVTDTRDLSRQIKTQERPGLLSRHQVIIQEDNGDGTVDVKVDGSDLIIPNMPCLAGTVYEVDDIAEAVSDGVDYFVLGKIGPTEAGGAGVPTGSIVMWSGLIADIPEGWTLCDGSNGAPDLRDKFLVGAGSTYAEGATGGANTVALTNNHLPSHQHSIGSHSHNIGNHYHSFSSTTNSYNHSHTGTATSVGHTHAGGSMTGYTSVEYHGHNFNTNSDNHSHNYTQEGHSTQSHGHTDDGVIAAGSSGTGNRSTSSVGSYNHSHSGNTSNSGHDHAIGNTSHGHDISTNSDNHSHSVSGNTGYSGGGNTATGGDGNTGLSGGGSAHENRPPYFAVAFIMKL